MASSLPDGSPCLPGDVVATLRGNVTVIAGRGIRSVTTIKRRPREGGDGAAVDDEVKLVATLCGTVRVLATTLSSAGDQRSTVPLIQYEVVAPSARRYLPELGDWVIGTIAKNVGANSYLVHINGPHLAVLDAVAFDGASKHSKPRLIPGDLVYGHVTDVDPEVRLSCCALPGTERKDWVTGLGTFGPLSSEHSSLLRVPLHYARELVSNANAPVLSMLGRRVAFEVAVGVNGIVWVHSSNTSAGGAKKIAGAAASSAVASAAASAVKNVADAESEWRAVRILAAICQYIVFSESDLTPQACQQRVDGYFPPSN